MNFLGLIIFLAMLYFVGKFFFSAAGHLFRVFGWIGSDISKSVSSVLDSVSTPETDEDDIAPEEDVEIFPGAPKRKIVELTAHDTSPVNSIKPTASDALDSAVKETYFNREPIAEQARFREAKHGYSSIEFLVHLLVVAGCAVTDLLVSLLVLKERTIAALKMPFPIRCSLWYAEIFLCALPLVIFMNVPDIHGYNPTIKAAETLGILFLGFIVIIYLARIIAGFDFETVFQTAGQDVEDLSNVPFIVKSRHSLLALAIFATSLLVIYKLVAPGLLVLGFFYSLMYFTAFANKDNRDFTFGKFIISWVVFSVATIAAIVVVKLAVNSGDISDYSAPIVMYIAAIAVFTIYMMNKKYNVTKGMRELPLRGGLSWLNQFVSPMIKAAVAIPMFYFVILFFSVNTAACAAGAAAAVTLVLIRERLQRKLPSFFPGGQFTAYMILVWISIFYVQTYNRMPPPASACSAVSSATGIKTVFSQADFEKYDFLKNTLPYDAAYDPHENALFASFKNLSGYGAVLRMNPETGAMTNHVITENDRYPGKMFYPERFCIDHERQKLYVTTKSNNNFQLLSFDYSAGLELDDRIRFPEFETTNCRVDERNGDIYVIFLGPPDNHLRLVDGGTHEEKGSMHFGRFGYADYFEMNKETGRMVFPSLDPANLFAVYDVENYLGKGFTRHLKKVKVPFRIFGLLKVGIPLPTLGIAANNSTGMLYFTSPFTRHLFEVDPKNFSVTRKMIAGRFPREMVVNDKTGILLVANYGDGTVDAIDLKYWKRLATINVGKLVRSITVDQETGRTYAVSACGINELDMDYFSENAGK